MRKLLSIATDDPPPPRMRRIRIGLAILLGLALIPLIYEEIGLCCARWGAMYGTIPAVETPVLDALGSTVGEMGTAFRRTVGPLMNRLPWDPLWVIGLGFAWALGGSLLMSRR